MSNKYRLRKKRAAAALIIMVLPFILYAFFGRKEQSQKHETSYTYVMAVSTSTVTTEHITTTTQAVTIPHIYSPVCKAAAFYSADDKNLLYCDNIEASAAPASLTKLLTASVALHYADPDEVFTVGSEQWLVQPYSSLCYIEIGSSATLKDLITGMLMASGNDAAYTIAVSTARYLNPDVQMSDTEAVQYFCRLMNDFASGIGMLNSHFVNPDGWDDEAQYTTVSDLIILAEYAFSVQEIREITGTFRKQVIFVSGEIYEWTNSNLLLDPYSEYYCENAVGMKTGTTQNAGNCLISAFIRNGHIYISVVVGCNSDADRYDLTLKLYDLSKTPI